jgi:hypothetical protein
MSRFNRCALLTSLGAVLAALLVAAAAPTARSASTPTTFSGQATVVKGSLSLLPSLVQSTAATLLPCKTADPTHFCITDTGPVSAGGGALNESLLCYPDGANCAVGLPDATGGAVSARVLHASVVSQGNKSHADATVANVGVVIPGVGTVDAEFVRADAEAKCTQGNASVSGGVELAKVNGQQVLVVNNVSYTIPESTPNYEVQLLPAIPGVRIVVNEQPASNGSSNGSGQIDVTAIHIYTPLGDIAIGQVHADIACGQLIGCPGQNAFVTSGGYIADPVTAAKLQFAAAGRNNAAWGHVVYGPTDLHVKDPTGVVFTSLAGLEGAVPAGFSAFQGARGTLESNVANFQGAAILTWTSAKSGTPSPGEALLIDMGEPGNQPKGYDFFELASGGGSSLASVAGGFLQGGNVQMHGKC